MMKLKKNLIEFKKIEKNVDREKLVYDANKYKYDLDNLRQ